MPTLFQVYTVHLLIQNYNLSSIPAISSATMAHHQHAPDYQLMPPQYDIASQRAKKQWMDIAADAYHADTVFIIPPPIFLQNDRDVVGLIHAMMLKGIYKARDVNLYHGWLDHMIDNGPASGRANRLQADFNPFAIANRRHEVDRDSHSNVRAFETRVSAYTFAGDGVLKEKRENRGDWQYDNHTETNRHPVLFSKKSPFGM